VATVVAKTREAVDLLMLPTVTDPAVMAYLEQAGSAPGGDSALVASDGRVVPLAPGVTLGAAGERFSALLRDCPDPGSAHVVLAGALCEPFADQVLAAPEPPMLVVRDASAVLLENGLHRHRRRGLRIRVVRPTEVVALTVNPVAPQSHRFDSRELRAHLSDAISGVPIFDVLAPDFRP
jgi:hypothetical protein